MGDLAIDTAVEEVGEGRYRAHLRRDWEIWGPMGGYVAAIALRAAGASSSFARPASFSCHYLSVAAFDDVDIDVVSLRRGRSTESMRVSMTQGTRPILEAVVWSTGAVEGLAHDVTEAPAVPEPHGLANTRDLMPDDPPLYPFWENFEQRPVVWRPDWPPSEPFPPTWRSWLRFQPTATFDDPWVDAARAVVLVDVVSWPAAHLQHAWKWPDRQEWIAPSLDLYVAFHQPCPAEEWLLADGHAPYAGEGLIGWNGRVWSASGTLVASGQGQLLCRRVPPPS